MKGVAPNGSMLASSILLIMELPAMEAARPALKPAREHAHDTHKHTTPHREVRRSHNGGAATSSCVLPRQQRAGFAVKTVSACAYRGR